MPASLVIRNHDLSTIDPALILSTGADRTGLGGRIVYERQGATRQAESFRGGRACSSVVRSSFSIFFRSVMSVEIPQTA